MAISSALVVPIGTSLARHLISLWMGKGTVASDVTENLTDYFLHAGATVLDARSAERTFQELGDRMAASLIPLFEAEPLDENGIQAVTHAVSQTIGETSIRVLIDDHMDPEAITRRLLDMTAHRTALFSSDECSLYERCIRACVIQMTGLIAKSPEFVGAALSDLLRHHSIMVDQITYLGEQIQSLTSLTTSTHVDDSTFEEQYRRAIVGNLDRVDLFGLDLRDRASRKQKLSLAYTGLSSSRRVRVGADEEDDTVPVEQLVASSPYLLIRGQPGSEKTTLLKWIAINTAQRTLATADLGDNIPFYLPLRQYSTGDLPGPETFVRPGAPSLAGAMPPGWAHRCLASRRGTILIDSVDEIPRARRRRVREWLDDLMRTYPGNRYIITSRPYALLGSWESADGFIDTELQPMELADIYAFIDRWHLAVETEMRDRSEIDELEAAKRKLKIEVDRNLALRHIATNPLLCAALCALNRDRHQKLPTDRIDVYDAFCDMLLERRDREQGLEVEQTDYPVLSSRQKKAILEDLAYYMLRNRCVSISVADALQRLELKMDYIPNLDSTPRGVLSLLTERSGIIREPAIGEVDFTHRTLQEFLAAHAIDKENDTGVLLQHLGDDRWREVIILLAGLAGASKTERIITTLLEEGNRDTSHRHQRHLLAVACLDTAVQLSPRIQQRVTASLAALIPPATLDDARLVASAGNLAVPHLGPKPHYTAQQASTCIRALSFIATDAAMEAIKTYAADARPQVLREAIRAAESFPAQTYFNTVLSRFNVRNVTLRGVRSLQGLDALGDLESLSLTLADNVKDLSLLRRLTKLKKLEIRGDNVTLPTLDCIATLGDLQTLSIEGEVRSSIEALRHTPHLQHLTIRNCSRIGDYSALSSLSSLRTVALERCDRLSDLSCFSRLQQLESLTLHGMHYVRDLTPLSHAELLTALDIAGLDRVFSLAPLRSLTQLRTLVLGDCDKELDVSPVGDLMHLERLHIHDVHSVTGLTALTHLTELRSLGLICTGGRPIDLTAIASMAALESLQLHGFTCQDDMTFLHLTTHLQALSLEGFHEIRTIDVLARLPAIESLYLSGFRDLDDLTPLAALPDLHTTVLIPSSTTDSSYQKREGWGSLIRGGLKAVNPGAAKRQGYTVYFLERAMARGGLRGREKIIEARRT